MPHLNEDDLLQLAFGEPAGQAAAEHLAGCDRCRAEVAKLGELVGIGRQSAALRDLPPPPERVWQGIAAQTASPARRRQSPPAPQRWLRLALVGAAAALAAVVGTWAWLRAEAPTSPVAVAELSAYGTTPAQAHGTAQVRPGRTLTIDVADLPPAGDGYYEVWLIDPGTLQMFSVGVMGGTARATFTLPPNADLGRYRVVDVSAEQFDNQPEHSGNSLLRGTLSGLD